MAYPSDLVIRPYRIATQGFGEYEWFARSRGNALTAAWRSFCSYRDDVSFGDFLKMAKVTCMGEPSDRFGEAITVCGLPAYWVSCDRQYVQFVRPDSDVVLSGHPLDVDPPEARRGTTYTSTPPIKGANA